MKRTSSAFTLIEFSVAILIFSLLSYSVLLLLTQTRHRFQVIEDDVVSMTQLGLILRCLRSDLEGCRAFGNFAHSLEMAQNAVLFSDNVLSFDVLDGDLPKKVTYSFNEQTNTLEYFKDGKTTFLGKGMVRKFFVCHQILCEDDSIRSIPYDPDQVGPEPEISDPPPNAGRSWIKVYLEMAKINPTTKKEVRQTYVFRFFPFQLNRQIQTIWDFEDSDSSDSGT